MPRKTLLALAFGILLTPLGALAAQSTVLTGSVKSNAQNPIPGAFVSIPALSMTQVANSSGEYRFVIPENRVTGQEVTIEVRSIGHISAEARVRLRPGTITQNMVLTVRAVQLDEVVVSGTAGRQERRAQSATVASIDAAELIEKAPVSTVAQLLTARTPGLVMRQQSGSSGTYTDIRIRGISSMTLSNEPLVYIDGVRVSGGSQQIYGVGGQNGSRLNDVKIEDIESMDVVKGPAAATLYGSDAVAGVINIITKKGRAGSTFVQTMNAEYGEMDPSFTPPDNYGKCTAAAMALPLTYPNCVGKAVDQILSDNPLMRDASFGNGSYRNINYSLAGGGEKFGTYFSMGGNRELGTVPTNIYQQSNSRASFDYAVRDNLHMDIGFGLIRVVTNLPQNDNNIYGYLGGGLLGEPRTIGARKNGWYAQRQTFAIDQIETNDKTIRFQPRASVSYSPMSWFKNKVTLGGDLARTEAFQFWSKNDSSYWDSAPQNTGEIREARRVEDRVTLEYLGTVTRNLTDDIRLDLSAGSQAQTRRRDDINSTGQGLINNDVRSVNAASTLLNGGQSSAANRDFGVFTQADFSWRERIYLQLGIRRDQSSSFGADSKPFFSPKVGLSYVISDEDYFKSFTSFLPEGAISQLRLRAAYGVSGRQPTSGARSTYSPSTNLVGTALAVGVRPGNTGNPLIRAEKGQETEFGFDAGIIDDRLSLEATYFHKKGIDQILTLPVPGSLGVSGPSVNVGALLNTGLELASEARILTRENVAFQVRGSLATLKNKVVSLGDVPASPTRKVGFPLSGNWDYVIDSIKVDPANYLNSTVWISDSLTFFGNGANYPGWDAALTGTLTLFQNLSFYAQMDGRGDRLVFESTGEFRDRQFGQSEAAVRGAAAFGTNPDGTPTAAAIDKYLRRYGPFKQKTQPAAPLPNVVFNRALVSGDYLQDGTFWRLREASVNYALPNSFVRQYVRARSASVGVTMKNLKTWTNFEGLDPETDQFLVVPSDKRWTVRFQVTF